MSCDAFETSLPAHATAKSAVEPPPPTSHIPPKPMDIGLSLVKPAGTLTKAAEALPGGPELAARMELVAEKVETTRGFSDVALDSVQAQMKWAQDRMQGGDGARGGSIYEDPCGGDEGFRR
jgi:hypothetical protein